MLSQFIKISCKHLKLPAISDFISATTSPSISLIKLLCSLMVLSILPLPSRSADPDPLQDFCVADLNATISLNGFPCKPAAQEEHFINYLTPDVWIVKELPVELQSLDLEAIGSVVTDVDIPKESKPSFYLKNYCLFYFEIGLSIFLDLGIVWPLTQYLFSCSVMPFIFLTLLFLIGDFI
ncbi:O-fucosyltransferase family protein [Melia azedarach]|uniref:O-fucosyltransferase family protein n=1 Tax=Melia azedarach TaxID=155640 RepID=A0ACC1X3E3_MELAZ|nr:O-fucosyltransferase family protein [Melia azedarach]